MKTPGLQYVAVTANGVLANHAVGWADLRHRVAMTPATTMMAYSMSKTVTAVAVLQLVERGLIALEDPAAEYLDVFPYGRGVTVRQLLAHTSGVPNPIPLRWVHPASGHDRFDERSALAAVLQKHSRLSSVPGTKYRYSNIGYWLLGGIVERASGIPFQEYVTGHVLQPLGITPQELGYVVCDPQGHATGYLEKYSVFNLVKGMLVDRELIGQYSGAWLEIKSHYPDGPAFGGLVGTALAFGRFLQDQLRERSVLIDGDARRWLYTRQHTTRGMVIPMTLGWHVDTSDGREFFYKEGGGGGFHCEMRLYPATGIGTVLMTNATGVDVRRALREADRRYPSV